MVARREVEGPAGDANRNGRLTIDEILTVSVCTVCDDNRDGEITIEELIVAVKRALDGCPAGADV